MNNNTENNESINNFQEAFNKNNMDQLLNNIMGSPLFNNMVQEVGDKLGETPDDSKDISNNSSHNELEETLNNSLLNVLSSFLIDKDGNNICDILNNLNDTLTTISKKLK